MKTGKKTVESYGTSFRVSRQKRLPKSGGRYAVRSLTSINKEVPSKDGATPSRYRTRHVIIIRAGDIRVNVSRRVYIYIRTLVVCRSTVSPIVNTRAPT